MWIAKCFLVAILMVYPFLNSACFTKKKLYKKITVIRHITNSSSIKPETTTTTATATTTTTTCYISDCQNNGNFNKNLCKCECKYALNKSNNSI